MIRNIEDTVRNFNSIKFKIDSNSRNFYFNQLVSQKKKRERTEIMAKNFPKLMTIDVRNLLIPCKINKRKTGDDIEPLI